MFCHLALTFYHDFRWLLKIITAVKAHIFWEGHKILRNLNLTFVLCSASQKWGAMAPCPFRFPQLCNTFNFVILGRIQFACCLRHTRSWLDLLPPMEVPCICTPHFTWQPVMATSKHDFYSHHECYLQNRDWWKKTKMILAFREKVFFG